MSSVACSAGFASCKTFGKQPKHPCLVWGDSPTLSPGIDAGRVCPRALQGRIQVVEQSRCRTHRQQTTTIAQMQSQQSIHSLSPRERGLGFRQGCRDRTPKGFARTQSPQSVLIGIENLRYFYKYRLFLQTDRRHSLRFLFVYITLNCPLKQIILQHRVDKQRKQCYNTYIDNLLIIFVP